MYLLDTGFSPFSVDKHRNTFSIPTFNPTFENVNKSSLHEIKNDVQSGKISAESRMFSLNTDIISRAIGSAYLEYGNSKVICGIYGPRPIKNEKIKPKFSQFSLPQKPDLKDPTKLSTDSSDSKKLKTETRGITEKISVHCELKFSTFSDPNYTLSTKQQDKETEMSRSIAEVLETVIIGDNFPRSVIDVNILILENDGTAMTTAILCANFALLNAGIPMSDTITSCSVSQLPNNIIAINPTLDQERNQVGSIKISYLPNLNKIAYISQTGSLKIKQTRNCIKEALNGCKITHKIFSEYLLESIK